MKALRILHLEDDPSHALLVRKKIEQSGIPAEILWARSPEEFQKRLAEGQLEAVVLDNGLPGFSGNHALNLTREWAPRLPVIILSSSASETHVAASLQAGASEYVVKGHWWQLLAALRRVQHVASVEAERSELERHDAGMSCLVKVVQELSRARDLPTLTTVVCAAARRLTNALGATFISRENGSCHYLEEDSPAPVWKGRNSPAAECLSEWPTRNGRTLASEDVQADPRVPKAAYSGTGIRSVIVVPIRARDPLGAIGVYWTERHRPDRGEIDVLEALANTAGVVMDNLHLYANLERRVCERTLQLEDAIRELEAFSYSVSHDLRSPLQTIGGFAELVAMSEAAQSDPSTRSCVEHIQGGVERMTRLVDDLLRLAQIGREELHLKPVDLSAIATAIIDEFRAADPERKVEVDIQPEAKACADSGLMEVVLRNVLGNAWKYTAKVPKPRIQFGTLPDSKHGKVFFVRDNGAGFDPARADKLFTPFQRLHSRQEFSGSGIGLATVQRAIHRHAGQVWATGILGEGATFFFTLPEEL